MKYIILYLLTLAILFPMNGLELAKAVESRNKPMDVKSTNTMILTNKDGKTKTRELISLSKDDSEKQIIWFLKPAKDKGIAFLKIEHKDKDDFMTMWLPGFNRFRRIASSKKSDSFMGSDLSFEDLTNRDIKDYSYNILNNKECNYNDKNYNCYELESIPIDIDSEYSRHITWIIEIEEEVFITIKEHSFNKENNLLKIKSIQFNRLDSYYIMNRLDVKNVQKNHSTLLTVNNITINNDVADSKFVERTLKILP